MIYAPLTDDDPRHGFPRGYLAHLRQKTVPCDPCASAMAISRFHERVRKMKQQRADRFVQMGCPAQ